MLPVVLQALSADLRELERTLAARSRDAAPDSSLEYDRGFRFGRFAMSIVVRFAPVALTAAKYDEAVRRIDDAGLWPPDGMDYHVCFGSDGNLRVSEIWDSREQWQAFGERLMPILAEVGIEPGEPEIYEVHNIRRR